MSISGLTSVIVGDGRGGWTARTGVGRLVGDRPGCRTGDLEPGPGERRAIADLRRWRSHGWTPRAIADELTGHKSLQTRPPRPGGPDSTISRLTSVPKRFTTNPGCPKLSHSDGPA